MTGGALSMHYPRRTLQRSVLRMLGRALLPVLLRVRVTGTRHFPAHGPLLVVGNHVGAVEVPLMIAYAPRQIEMLGPGDIPPPPALDAITRLYGYTAIHRSNVDRLPLIRMLDVLGQRGVVGLFPEGGIWDPGTKPTKRGVARLSHRAQAPILPVGFGSLEGALNAASRLQRPKVSMNVGERMLHYVRHANPGFFTYRFGYQEGKAMEAGLSELYDLATRQAAAGRYLRRLAHLARFEPHTALRQAPDEQEDADQDDRQGNHQSHGPQPAG